MGNSSTAQQLYSYWNDREFDRLAELLTDDGEIVLVGSGTRFEGHEGAKEFSRMWADGFPDGKVQIDDVIEAGDRVVVQFTGRGTHTGTLRSPGGEIPASGRSVTLKLCDVHRIENGKIKSVHSYFDSASLLTQIGAMPAAGVASA
jgi:steroid delta-isomerase-like uncharacterized protein